MKNFLACLLAMLGLNTACGQQNFEDADVQQFSQIIADSSVVLLDVRTDSEFADGHLKGAVHVDQAQSAFVEKVQAQIPVSKKIAVYCRSGRRSANAANRLAAQGYRCVNLKGGILAWKRADMPVEK